MENNLDIENALMKKALKVGGLHAKKEMVTKALEEIIRRRQQRTFFGRWDLSNFAKDGTIKLIDID